MQLNPQDSKFSWNKKELKWHNLELDNQISQIQQEIH
jgi:hypothetical protein